MLISSKEKSLGFLSTRFSTGELFLIGENQKLTLTWSKFRLGSKLLRIMKLIVIWSYSRLCSDLLGKIKLNSYLVGFQVSQEITWKSEVRSLSTRIPGFATTY